MISKHSNKKLNKSLVTKLSTLLQSRLKGTGFKAFMFGSRVSGKPKERSDYDIAIEGENAVPAILRFAIKDDFDQLSQRIDLIDFSSCDATFKSMVKQMPHIYLA